MEKILEIALDKGINKTVYCTMNYSVGCDSKFFEGTIINNKKITPLKEAKIWAKSNGYTHLKVISLKFGKSDKIYCL